MRPLCVMLVAGEASGDALGAALGEALRRRLGEEVRFVGVGGTRMAELGVVSPFDIAEISIVGIVESLRAYPRVLRCVEAAAEVARREKPDVAVLIDSWGYTLRVAKALRRVDPQLPLIKYVGPQVWAWRSGRAKTLAGAVDHLLATQVMDGPYYEAVGLPHTFVGNPAMQADFSHADGARFREEAGVGPDEPVLLVLPGSRPREIERLMPAFEQTAARLKAERPDLQVVVPAADTVRERVLARVAGWPFRAHVTQGEPAKYDAMKAATVALACSGTVTTELALAGCPMIVGYKVDAPTYIIAKTLVNLRWVTLMNIAAGREVVPEFLQGDCTPEKLTEALASLLDNRDARESQLQRQRDALRLMGREGPPAAEMAADTVLKILGERGRLALPQGA